MATTSLGVQIKSTVPEIFETKDEIACGETNDGRKVCSFLLHFRDCLVSLCARHHITARRGMQSDKTLGKISYTHTDTHNPPPPASAPLVGFGVVCSRDKQVSQSTGWNGIFTSWQGRYLRHESRSAIMVVDLGRITI